MRVKTSITLDREVIRELDRLAGESNRSRIVEEAIRRYLAERARNARDARDVDRINRSAEALNREMEDVLEDQAT